MNKKLKVCIGSLLGVMIFLNPITGGISFAEMDVSAGNTVSTDNSKNVTQILEFVKNKKGNLFKANYWGNEIFTPFIHKDGSLFDSMKVRVMFDDGNKTVIPIEEFDNYGLKLYIPDDMKRYLREVEIRDEDKTKDKDKIKVIKKIVLPPYIMKNMRIGVRKKDDPKVYIETSGDFENIYHNGTVNVDGVYTTFDSLVGPKSEIEILDKDNNHISEAFVGDTVKIKVFLKGLVESEMGFAKELQRVKIPGFNDYITLIGYKVINEENEKNEKIEKIEMDGEKNIAGFISKPIELNQIGFGRIVCSEFFTDNNEELKYNKKIDINRDHRIYQLFKTFFVFPRNANVYGKIDDFIELNKKNIKDYIDDKYCGVSLDKNDNNNDIDIKIEYKEIKDKEAHEAGNNVEGTVLSKKNYSHTIKVNTLNILSGNKVEVENSNQLTVQEKESVKNKVIEVNLNLSKEDLTVNNDGSVNINSSGLISIIPKKDTVVEKPHAVPQNIKVINGVAVPKDIVAVTVTNGTKITAESGEENGLKINTDGKVVGTPTNVTFEEGKDEVTVTIKVPVISEDKVKKTIDVPVTVVKSDADKNTPEGKEITVDKNHVLNAEDAEKAIENKTALQKAQSYSWKEPKPSTAVAGSTNTGTVIVTYADGTTDEVPVTVNVKVDPSVTLANPAPSVTNGIKVADGTNGLKLLDSTYIKESTIKEVNGLKLNLAGDVVGTPMDIQFPAGKDSAIVSLTVTVVSKDKVEEQRTVNVTVNKNQADLNTPTGGSIKVNKDKKLDETDAKTAITNNDNLQNVKIYTWKSSVSTAIQGSSNQGVVVVTYNDESKDEVSVTVNVKADPSYNINPITIKNGIKVADNTTIVQLLDSTTIEAESSTVNGLKIDTNGKLIGTPTNVTFQDVQDSTTVEIPVIFKSKDNVEPTINVPVTVEKSDADKNTPEGKGITVDKNHVLNAEDAKTAIGNSDTLQNAQSYSWKDSKPSTAVAGSKNTGTVIVTYADGSIDEVEVTVNVKSDPSVTLANPAPSVVNGVEVPEDTVAVTVSNGTTIPAESGVKNGLKINKDGKVVGTPTNVTFEEGKDKATVNIEVPVISKDKVGSTIQVPVTVVKSDADKNTPEGKGITVNKNHELNAEDAEKAIENKTALQNAQSYSWDTPLPDTTTAGKSNNGTVIVTYADRSIDKVEITVNVKSDPSVTLANPTPSVVNGVEVPKDTVAVTVSEGTTIPADSGEVNGLKINTDGKVVGTPTNVTFEEGKDKAIVEIPVTFKSKDGVEQEIKVPVTITIKPRSKDRVSGANRIETATRVSSSVFYNGCDTVILVNAHKSTDSLASIPYANLLKASLLFTDENSIPKETALEMQRLGAKKVIIIGGENSVSKSIQDILSKDYSVDRVDGRDRFDTARIISDRIKQISGNREVIVASGEKFADALSISPLAVKNNIPVLLTRSNNLPKYTEDALNSYNGIEKIYVVGGYNSVSDSVNKEIKKYTKNPITKFAGVNRYETSVLVAKNIVPKAEKAIFANGYVFADALLSGVLLQLENSPILLVTNNHIPAEVSEYVKSSNIKNKITIGGEKVISNHVLREIDDLIKNK